MSKAAVTGASGYVGGEIAAHFQSRGWTVFGLSRRPTHQPGIAHIPWDLGGPLNLPKDSVDVLVHSAYDFSPIRKAEIERINRTGTENLIAQAKELGIERIILISTLSAFTGTRSVYGQTKLAMEKLVLEAKGAVVRPGLVYGNAGGGMMKKMEDAAAAHRWMLILNHGRSRLFTAHAEDLSRLVFELASCASWPPPQSIYLAAHRKGWTLTAIVQRLASQKGRSIRLIGVPWRLAWLGLKAAEFFGLRLPFRSDSVLSLAEPNPDVERQGNFGPAGGFREFGNDCKP